jgi:hypothetical protein
MAEKLREYLKLHEHLKKHGHRTLISATDEKDANKSANAVAKSYPNGIVSVLHTIHPSESWAVELIDFED